MYSQTPTNARPRIRTNGAFAFTGVTGRGKALTTPHAREMLAGLPDDVRRAFVRYFLDNDQSELDAFIPYFNAHSTVSRIILDRPSSAHAFETLYHRRADSPIDRYFLASPAGTAVYRRLLALEETLPGLIRDRFPDDLVLIDNVGSGQGYDMIRVLAANPDLAGRVHVRNIDPDGPALELGRRVAEESGLGHNFEWLARPFEEAPPRGAHFVLLIGVFCPLNSWLCRQIAKRLQAFTGERGLLVFSTAQDRMGKGDPLTDCIMRFGGWCMDYKTDGQAWDIAENSGWHPMFQFFDQPHRYHCMTVAEKP